MADQYGVILTSAITPTLEALFASSKAVTSYKVDSSDATAMATEVASIGTEFCIYSETENTDSGEVTTGILLPDEAGNTK